MLPKLVQDAAEWAEEFADWEAASDEDWLHMEAALADQGNKSLTLQMTPS
ncbi:MAG: hypothetical protein HC772_14675 [Leptolyngbyaceae cyanobacterium CRU_2_3]|nr:hypothetical protein [Leptolyngbyaceae cyanobacterium CRU_2_3]